MKSMSVPGMLLSFSNEAIDNHAMVISFFLALTFSLYSLLAGLALSVPPLLVIMYFLL
jgi:hypothetical protein